MNKNYQVVVSKETPSRTDVQVYVGPNDERGILHDYVRVTGGGLDFQKQPRPFEVSWSSIGSVDIETAFDFSHAVTDCATFAQVANIGAIVNSIGEYAVAFFKSRGYEVDVR